MSLSFTGAFFPKSLLSGACVWLCIFLFIPLFRIDVIVYLLFVIFIRDDILYGSLHCQLFALLDSEPFTAARIWVCVFFSILQKWSDGLLWQLIHFGLHTYGKCSMCHHKDHTKGYNYHCSRYQIIRGLLPLADTSYISGIVDMLTTTLPQLIAYFRTAFDYLLFKL